MNFPRKHISQRFLIFQRVLTCALGAVFVFASWHKILNPAEFAKIIYGYGLFPGSLINIFAICVPFVELVCGICLISGVLRQSSLLVCNAMLLGFILIISINLIRGHEFDCGCFSFAHHNTTQAAISLLIRDVILLGTGLYLYFHHPKSTA